MTYNYEQKYEAQCPFLRACGLRRSEAWRLQVGDVTWRDGHLYVYVRESRVEDLVLIAAHIAPVVPGQEQAIMRLIQGRAKEEQVFKRPSLTVPSLRVVYSLRRQYARALYQFYDPSRKLPGAAKCRITSTLDYDEAAANRVASAVGYSDLDDLEGLVRAYLL